MANGGKAKAQEAAGHGDEKVRCTFTITINVQPPHDVAARVRTLVDAEFQRLTTAVQQKKK